MTSPEMQRRVPERSTGNGARQKESITLPDGHTITATGKGVQTRLRAYALKKDQAQQPNAPTLLLESLFDNEATLKQLVRNGPKKAPILEKAKQQINNFGLQEKIIFLEKAFAVLSNPDPGSQNQRDAVLELLNIMDLKGIGSKELKKTYLKAVSNLRKGLNENSDPYGEIYMLLEAGKTIAPFFENGRNADIVQTWNRVAKFFKGADRQQITDAIQQIMELTPEFQFDAKVLLLVKQGIRNPDIARGLRVELIIITRSLQRLRSRGIRLGNFDRRTGRLPNRTTSDDTGSE